MFILSTHFVHFAYNISGCSWGAVFVCSWRVVFVSAWRAVSVSARAFRFAPQLPLPAAAAAARRRARAA
ncbi:hypothetical protein [Methanimicrococcus hongohii]|uniref:hypothetical protein n=1 Tax=Methanimicrococcus hongohii TaxID=3028295 RepID=UPI002930A44B|nr:hypothetical protein [Methanimicrococcus sp. Hf6]